MNFLQNNLPYLYAGEMRRLIFLLICCSSTKIGQSDGWQRKVSAVGHNVQLHCILPPSQKLHSVKWDINGNEFLTKADQSGEEIVDGCIVNITEDKSASWLEIPNVTFEKAGNYTCEPFLNDGLAGETDWTLQIQGHPVLSLELQRKYSTANEIIKASCCISFALQPKQSIIEWRLDYVLILPNSTNQTQKEQGVEMCSSVVFPSKPSYNRKDLTCLVQNQLKMSSSVNLDVRYPATVDMLNTFSIRTLTIILVEEGSDINITCTSRGNPEPKVFLEKNFAPDQWQNATFTPSMRYKHGDEAEWVFLMKNISEESTGIVRCAASNGVGSIDVSKQVQIELQVATSVTMVNPPVLDISLHDELKISCKTKGNPSPKVKLQKLIDQHQWTDVDMTVYLTKTGTFTTTYTFVFIHANEEDSGTYRCMPLNKLGIFGATSNTTVVIEGVSTTNFITVFAKGNRYLLIIVSAALILIVIIITGIFHKRCSKRRFSLPATSTTTSDLNNIPVYASVPAMHTKVTKTKQHGDFCTFSGTVSNTSLRDRNIWSAPTDDDSHHSDFYMTPDVNILKLGSVHSTDVSSVRYVGGSQDIIFKSYDEPLTKQEHASASVDLNVTRQNYSLVKRL